MVKTGQEIQNPDNYFVQWDPSRIMEFKVASISPASQMSTSLFALAGFDNLLHCANRCFSISNSWFRPPCYNMDPGGVSEHNTTPLVPGFIYHQPIPPPLSVYETSTDAVKRSSIAYSIRCRKTRSRDALKRTVHFFVRS
jgi:hypothetical protein